MTEEAAPRSRPVRLGILVIHNDPVPETEIWTLAASHHHTVHTARFWTPRAMGVEFTGVGVDALIDETGLGDSVEQLRLLGVDALGYCFASSSVFGGTTFDRDFEARVSIRAGCPVTTTGTALREAFGRIDSRGVGIVVPPWFSDGTVTHLLDYLDPRLTRDDVYQFELPEIWAGIERPDLFDRGARHAINQDEVVRQTVDAFGGRVDTVVVPGSGFASLGAARILKADYGIDVVSANSSLFEALERAAYATAMTSAT